MNTTGAARAQARATEATQRTHERYAKRPAGVRVNSPVPRFGWIAQHALIQSYAVVLQSIFSFRPRELGKRGFLLRDASTTKITSATAKFTPNGLPMPRRTVGHALEALRKRGFIERWEERGEKRAPTCPFGTHYRMPLYDEILQRWADDPEIGTVPRRAFFVIGKGRRFLTPSELREWEIDPGAAARNPAAHASAIDAEEAAGMPAEELTPPATMPGLPEPLHPDVEIVHRALMFERVDATPEQVAQMILLAREGAPEIQVDSVAALVRKIASDKHKQDHARNRSNLYQPTFLNAGWFLKGFLAAAHGWRIARKAGACVFCVGQDGEHEHNCPERESVRAAD